MTEYQFPYLTDEDYEREIKNTLRARLPIEVGHALATQFSEWMSELKELRQNEALRESGTE